MTSLEPVSVGEGAESNQNRSCALITALITAVQMNVGAGAVFRIGPRTPHVCTWQKLDGEGKIAFLSNFFDHI